MILRNCVHLVKNRPNFTFIWVISVYVMLGQPAVPAHSPPVGFKNGQPVDDFCNLLHTLETQNPYI